MGRDARDYGANPSSEAAPLLPHGAQASLFVPLESRSRKDSAWTVSWALLYVFAVAAGIVMFLKRNVNFATEMSPSYLDDASHCPAHPARRARSLFGMREDNDDPIQLDEFMSHALVWLIGSLVGALLVGVAFVLLVSRSPRFLVGLAIAVQVGLPLVGGTSLLAQGNAQPGFALLLLAGVLVLMFWLWREQLQLVIQLLGISGRGLHENLGLIGAVLGIQAGLLLLTLPLLVSFLAGLTNGHVVYNPQRAHDSPQCVDEGGKQVSCCAWQVESYVGPLMALTALTMMWTSAIGGQVRTFTVAGTIAQWYFAPVASQLKQSRGRVGRSLRAALGPAFGSLVFGGLILTIVSLLRSMLEQLRKKARDNIFMYCLFVAVQFVFTLVELVTKFATVRLAITGEAFVEAGRGVSDLLKRNFLDAYGVWWFPPMILQMSAIVLSGVWSFGVYCFSAAAWRDLHQGHQYAGIVAVVAFVLCTLVLSFFTSLLLNIIDTVFICFAMDRDMQACSRLDVHEVYSKLPSVGPVVQNPDGAYAYAAPTRPVAP